MKTTRINTINFGISISLLCYVLSANLELQAQQQFPQAAKASQILFKPVRTNQYLVLDLDRHSGDLCISVSNKSKNEFEFDTNLFSLKMPEFKLLFLFYADKKSGMQTTDELMPIETINPKRTTFKISKNILPPQPIHRKISLSTGESYFTCIKIWEIDIWSQLVKAFAKNPNDVYILKFFCRDAKFPTYTLEVNHQFFQHFQNVKNKQDNASERLQYKDKPPRWYLEGLHLEAIRKQQETYKQRTHSPLPTRLSFDRTNGVLTCQISNDQGMLVTLDLDQQVLDRLRLSDSKQTATALLTDSETSNRKFKQFRVIDLEEGEGFRWSTNISQTNIWPDLQRHMSKNKEKSFFLCTLLRCWIDGKEYNYPVEGEFSYQDIKPSM